MLREHAALVARLSRKERPPRLVTPSFPSIPLLFWWNLEDELASSFRLQERLLVHIRDVG